MAVEIGLKLTEYWQLTPREFVVYVKGYKRKLKTQFELLDQANHLLGKYIAYAVNDPKKYPKKPFTQGTNIKPKMTPEEMERFAKEYTRRFNNDKI